MVPPESDGRPTPQPVRADDGADDGLRQPRFRDVPPSAFKHPDANPYLVSHRTYGPPLLTADEAWRHRGRWHEAFGREAPLHVEIGSGNGFYLAAFAARHPEVNVLGIEIRYKRTVLCARKLDDAGVTNGRIARYHAAFLDDLFEPGSLAGLHVNHPDPWPKDRHEKNRLISRWFAEDAVRLLQPGGCLRLKTDHRPHIERLEHVLDHGPDDTPAPRLPFAFGARSEDANAEPFHWADGEADIETNYQSKFRARGLPVYTLELIRTDAPA